MNSEIENLINLYFDGELEKGKEPMLFSLLSQNENERNYFKQMHLLKSNTQFTIEEFPAELDEKILRTVSKTGSERVFKYIDKRIFDITVYAASVVLMILSIFFYSRSEGYKVQFFDLAREVKEQNQKINMLINALPQIDVQGSYVKVREVVVKPQS